MAYLPAKTVLLIEDDLDTRETLRTILQGEGYAVAEAQDGQAAIEFLRLGLHPQVIVMDICTPVMSGLEFRDIQRGCEEWRQIPIIATSGHAQRLEEWARAEAEIPVLRKPFSLDEILALVHRFDGY